MSGRLFRSFQTMEHMYLMDILTGFLRRSMDNVEIS